MFKYKILQPNVVLKIKNNLGRVWLTDDLMMLEARTKRNPLFAITQKYVIVIIPATYLARTHILHLFCSEKQYMLTCKVRIYCLLALHGNIQVQRPKERLGIYPRGEYKTHGCSCDA